MTNITSDGVVLEYNPCMYGLLSDYSIELFIAIAATVFAKIIISQRYRAAHPEMMAQWDEAMDESICHNRD